jgi:hypothetical protein
MALLNRNPSAYVGAGPLACHQGPSLAFPRPCAPRPAPGESYNNLCGQSSANYWLVHPLLAMSCGWQCLRGKLI